MLRTLKEPLLLLALVWPAAAPGMDQHPPRPSQAGAFMPLILPVQPIGIGHPGGFFLLDCRGIPLPPQDLEVFWSSPDGEAWIPLGPCLPDGGHLRCPAPPREPGSAMEFLVMSKGRPWGRASYGPPPAPGGQGQPGVGEAEVLAALALCQDLSDSGDPADRPVPPGGFPEGAPYLRRILQIHRIPPQEMVKGTEEKERASPLLATLQDAPGARARILTYAQAEEAAQALNRILGERHSGEAPFTAEELFLGGRSPAELGGLELLHFIILKDRHLHQDDAYSQADRLGVDYDAFNRRLRGQAAISLKFVEKLRAHLDLAALGLGEEDLDRLPCEAARPYANHPANARAVALYTKALTLPGSMGGKGFLKAIGMYRSRWAALRSGARRITELQARRMSAFHNLEFPEDPPTTPDYFLGF